MRTVQEPRQAHLCTKLMATLLVSITGAISCFAANRFQTRGDFFVGRPAPDFRLKDLDGHDVQLSSLKGDIVLLDFWASWCAPCRAEMPMIQSISKQFAKKNVVVIGVNSEEPEETVRRFVAKSKLTYQIVLTGNNPSVIRDYAASALPTVVIIDKSGIVAAYRVGERFDTENILHEDVHYVLSKKYVAPQPKPIPMFQKPAGLPAAPANAAAGSGPDPNWKPESAEEYLARGFARLNAHQNARAKTDAEEALKSNPGSSVALFLHGRAAYEEKDYATAAEDFNKVVQARPNWAQGYQFRGLSYSHLGQHERALPDYQKVLQLKPYMASVTTTSAGLPENSSNSTQPRPT